MDYCTVYYIDVLRRSLVNNISD